MENGVWVSYFLKLLLILRRSKQHPFPWTLKPSVSMAHVLRQRNGQQTALAIQYLHALSKHAQGPVHGSQPLASTIPPSYEALIAREAMIATMLLRVLSEASDQPNNVKANKKR